MNQDSVYAPERVSIHDTGQHSLIQNMGITVDFHEDGCAIITMRNGQNRWNPTSLKQFKEALDEVER